MFTTPFPCIKIYRWNIRYKSSTSLTLLMHLELKRLFILISVFSLFLKDKWRSTAYVGQTAYKEIRTRFRIYFWRLVVS